MHLAVVTVNYCCADAIVERLAATLREIRAAGGEWWIVDNKSPDNSLEVLRTAVEAFPDIHLIAAERNGGFGYGNNQLINEVLSRKVDADYVYFLNPDAAPAPGALPAMVAYLDEHPHVGVLGSGLTNEDGTHTDSMFRFPSFWSEIESALSFGPVSRLLRRHRQSLGRLEEPGPVDWVAGTSFMVRAQVFRKVGGFDEDFFLYWEEVELCHRIKKAGFAIHALPSAKVVHLGGVSTGMHRSENRIPDYWHQSRNLYFRKTGTGGPVPLLNIVTALGISLHRVLEFMKRERPKHPRFLRDHIKHAIHDGR